MLKAKNLHKIYKDGTRELHVLKGIDLAVNKGEAISILGPSGVGKSTLLHILGGLDRPTKGSVVLDGEDVYKLNDKKRSQIRNDKIGFVFQFYHLLPEFSVLENVMLPRLIARGRDAKNRAKEILEELGLGDRIGHKSGQLSGGEQQRVAIARALVNEPQVLLCDEPTGNLDSKTGEGIIDLLRVLNRERKTTVIAATHDRDIAEWTGRVVHMKEGMIE